MICRKSSECLRQPLENWEELHEHPRAEGPFRIGSSSRLAGASFLVGFDGIRHSPHLCKRRHGYGGHMVECLHLWPLPAHSLHSLLAGATAFASTSATHACCLVAWAEIGRAHV